jgi:Protein of unknown function (DUF1353)
VEVIMSGFLEGTVVDVEEINDLKWQLLKGISYRGNVDLFQVPIGQETDFASVPRIFVWFLPRYGRYTKAAILHDYLWNVQVPKGMSRLDADGLFRQAMRELEVPFLRRWIMWAAVRWAALFKRNGRKGWWKESLRVLAVTLLALIIILPPLIPILVALLTFYVMEWIAWIPLKCGQKARAKTRLPVKKVNKPKFTWSL